MNNIIIDRNVIIWWNNNDIYLGIIYKDELEIIENYKIKYKIKENENIKFVYLKGKYIIIKID